VSVRQSRKITVTYGGDLGIRIGLWVWRGATKQRFGVSLSVWVRPWLV
jgi:hypothetical protein